MPYSNVSELPASIKTNLPSAAQRIFLGAFNAAYSKYGEERAFKIAWAAVKNRFKKVGDKWVGKSSDFQREVYILRPIESTQRIVVKSLNDDVLIEGILATSSLDKQGKKFDKELLAKFADQGNSMIIKGNIDHAFLNALRKKYGNDFQKIITELNMYNSPIKATRFDIVDDGDIRKLLIRAIVDKDYQGMITNFDALSIEAYIDQTEGDTYMDGKLVGFAVTDNPVNTEAVITKKIAS